MKPVAWTEEELRNACRNARLTEEDFLRIKAYLPVYTAPQTNIKFNQTLECPSYLSGLAPRELSDVEIHYEVDKWERQNNYKHDADVHKTLIDFARAILKKASEK